MYIVYNIILSSSSEIVYFLKKSLFYLFFSKLKSRKLHTLNNNYFKKISKEKCN